MERAKFAIRSVVRSKLTPYLRVQLASVWETYMRSTYRSLSEADMRYLKSRFDLDYATLDEVHVVIAVDPLNSSKFRKFCSCYDAYRKMVNYPSALADG